MTEITSIVILSLKGLLNMKKIVVIIVLILISLSLYLTMGTASTSSIDIMINGQRYSGPFVDMFGGVFGVIVSSVVLFCG
jgi:amino acid permease